MVKNMPVFRQIVQARLGITWDRSSFRKVVVTEFEVRGLEGRGGFFDGVGQTRDMIQSHLLQVMALALMSDKPSLSRTQAKMEIFDKTQVTDCSKQGQYR